jgi:hypothetical protein
MTPTWEELLLHPLLQAWVPLLHPRLLAALETTVALHPHLLPQAVTEVPHPLHLPQVAQAVLLLHPRLQEVQVARLHHLPPVDQKHLVHQPPHSPRKRPLFPAPR